MGDRKYQALKTFLQKDAKTFHNENIARTYVLVDPDATVPDVIGYITLICSEITCKGGNATTANARADAYDTMPGVKIGRFAVHKDCQGMKYGTDLINWTLAEIITEIMPRIGCRFLIVDSKPGQSH